MRRFSLFVPLIFMILAPALPARAQPAAPAARCFAETEQCLAGRFRAYWEQHGGLAVFGYPITPAREERNDDTGQVYLTQWFERARFELHLEHRPPYDVLLGRLGAEVLERQGRDWVAYPRQDPALQNYFPETGYAIDALFLSYWRSHGLEFDGRPGTSFAESLALFGLPISEPRMETNASGATVLTQWFERARFEHHPDNPPAHQVLLGHLGAELPRTAPELVQLELAAQWGGEASPREAEFGYGVTVDVGGSVYVAIPGANQIHKYDAEGKHIAVWGAPDEAAEPLLEPRYVAVEQTGNVYVTHAEGVHKYSPEGRLLLAWGAPGQGYGQFNPAPTGIAVDQAGNVYVSDRSRVQKFSASGELLLAWGAAPGDAGPFGAPDGLAIDEAGNLYVADAGYSRVHKYSPEGRLLLSWGNNTMTPEGTYFEHGPWGIAADGMGHVYVGDGTRVFKFTTEGELLDPDVMQNVGWSEVEVRGLASNSSGQLYLARGDRVFMLDVDGTPLLEWSVLGSQAPGRFETPVDLVMDGAGNIYVADEYHGRIQKFNAAGELLLAWGRRGTGAGEFMTESSTLLIASDPTGQVYVLEVNAGRIQKFSSDGKLLLSWQVWEERMFNPPAGIAADAEGNVYVLDSESNQVLSFNSFGQQQTAWNVDPEAESREPFQGVWFAPLALAAGPGGVVHLAGFFVDWETNSAGCEMRSYSRSGALHFSFELSNLCLGFSFGTDNFNNKYLRIALDPAGNFYVTGSFRNHIQKYSPDGRRLLRWGARGSDGGQFERPGGLAVDQAGRVYVSDSGNHRVQVFQQIWGRVPPVGPPEPEVWEIPGAGRGHAAAYSTDLAVDRADQLYVLDLTSDQVHKFSPDGRWLLAWGEGGSDAGQFDIVTAIAVDHAGTVYVADESRVQKFSSEGAYLSGWRPRGEAAFKYASGLAVDAAGTIYIADDRILKFSPDGQLLAQWGWGMFDGGPSDLALDQAGNLYVAGGHYVFKFSPDGVLLAQWEGVAEVTGEHRGYLAGIAADNAGRVYVSDSENYQLRVFSAEGAPLGSLTYGDDEEPVTLENIAIDSRGRIFVNSVGRVLVFPGVPER